MKYYLNFSRVLKFSFLFLPLILSSCGSSEDGKNEIINIAEINSVDEESSIDPSLPFTQQLNLIISKLRQNIRFNKIEIKEISHPSKFVGTWTMWDSMRGDKITIASDGTCSNKSVYYDTGKSGQSSCHWYHITLAEKNTSLLLFFYPNSYTLVSYEWNDNNNFYIYYYRGEVQLASRVGSVPEAENVWERWLLGTWIRRHYGNTVFWKFGINNQLNIKTYSNENSQLLVDKNGTWNIDKTNLSISIPRSKFSSSYWGDTTNPDKTNSLRIETDALISNNFDINMKRFSEPTLIAGDPFLGKFQAYPNDSNNDALSLTIYKKDGNYIVDILLNKKNYKNNRATTANGFLYIPTSQGELIYKPVINGIQGSSNKKFGLNRRLSRTSQKTTPSTTTLIGRWVQGDSVSGKKRYFTFLKDGRFFHKNKKYGFNIGRAGTYEQNENKITLQPLCGKKVTDTIEFDELHYTPSSYGTTFIKIKDSQLLSSFWAAIEDFGENQKRQNIKIVPHPQFKDKFLFANKHTYNDTGFVNLEFETNGKVHLYIGFSFFHTYYIEKSKEKEFIILLREGEIFKTLPFYNARSTICYDNKFEAPLIQ
ncbi:MAG: hypothetical protein V3U75_09510 [Methylococcaceae bacterium]